MSDTSGTATVLGHEAGAPPAPSAETVAFADDIATSVRGFLDALPTIATQATPGQAVSLLLLEIAQVALAGARLGVQRDFEPREEYQPDVGPEADVEELRMRIAELLGDADPYSYVFDPYRPELVSGLLSDDLASIATDLELGLRHHVRGDADEALWWWQFSYVSSWGALAGAAMKALLSVVAHDRLDVDVPSERDQLADVSASLDSDGNR